MAWGSVVLTENPVTNRPKFHLSLPMSRIGNLRVKHRDMGGMWEASFDFLPDDRVEALSMLHACLGRQVQVFDSDGRIDFEGLVSTIEMDTGKARIENSLNDMGNKVWARYTALGGTTVSRSTVYQNSPSQSLYGIKEVVLSAGEVASTAANQFASNYLNRIYAPTPQLSQIDTGGTALSKPALRLRCIGYIRALEWRTYNQTALTGSTNAETVIAAIVTACGQFVSSTKYDPNNTQVTREYDQDRKALDIIESIVSLGDANGYSWVYGMEAGRTFYYRAASPPVRPAS
jgi:hypothetical protein